MEPKKKISYTECDLCGKKIPRKEVIKAYCGCGCYDYFCSDACWQNWKQQG